MSDRDSTLFLLYSSSDLVIYTSAKTHIIFTYYFVVNT